MRAGFNVVILTGEAQIEDELITRTVRTLVRDVVAEWIVVIPLPNNIPALIGDHSRCVQLICMDRSP